MMQARADVGTFNGEVVHYLGAELKVGDAAPDFELVDAGLKPATPADFHAKTKLFCTLPCLDMPECDTAARKFCRQAEGLHDNAVAILISGDLPFTQNRWRAEMVADKVKVLSDYQGLSFATAYGVLIKEFKLLARAIFVVDDKDVVQYVEYLADLSSEPDYAAAMERVAGQIATRQIPGDGFCGGY